MQYKDQLIRLMQNAADDFMKNLRAMPEDKLNWKVLEAGRSALDIAQECAQSPAYIIPILQTRSCPPFDPEGFGKMREERSKWTNLDDIERILKENVEAAADAIRAFPDEELSVEIDLPFAEGMRRSMAAIMGYPYWNLTYHLGQICFIQTLYGDRDMR